MVILVNKLFLINMRQTFSLVTLIHFPFMSSEHWQYQGGSSREGALEEVPWGWHGDDHYQGGQVCHTGRTSNRNVAGVVGNNVFCLQTWILESKWSALKSSRTLVQFIKYKIQLFCNVMITKKVYTSKYVHTTIWISAARSHTIHQNFIHQRQRCFALVWIKAKCFTEIQKL